jgi:hypothetical protein
VAACSRGELAPHVVVTTVPHLMRVTAEPVSPADSADWLVVTPLHLEAGRLNLEVTNRSEKEVQVSWGSARLTGLDGARRDLDVVNLKLDARGELPVPSKLPPYTAVQVRMTADTPRYPQTVADSAAAQELCQTLGGRESVLTLPAQRGREKRVYTVHFQSEVHVTMDGPAHAAFDCGQRPELGPT